MHPPQGDSRREACGPSCPWASAPEPTLPRRPSLWPLLVESHMSTRHQFRCPFPTQLHNLLVWLPCETVRSLRASTVSCSLLYPFLLSISLAASCYTDLVKIRKRLHYIICQKIVTCVQIYDDHVGTAPPGGVHCAALVLRSTEWAESGS